MRGRFLFTRSRSFFALIILLELCFLFSTRSRFIFEQERFLCFDCAMAFSFMIALSFILFQQLFHRGAFSCFPRYFFIIKQ
jgi:hypothetical protein